MEQGTYEVIQQRLLEQQSILSQKIANLNEARKLIFGAVDAKLVANERINTQNNCVARDIWSWNDWCIFGYNVYFGLRKEIKLEDVFSIYHFDGRHFKNQTLELINDERFELDFQNLYRYYRDTFFAKFTVLGNYLYMVFQTSEKIQDFKAFKWLIESDRLVYIDNRSEHEYRYPSQHGFEWQRAGRDAMVNGRYPHISLSDIIFVNNRHGKLTFKLENNTEGGEILREEDITQTDQTLDDAEFWFCDIGNLLLIKIKPYLETERYFIFNKKIKRIYRADSLKDCGILLPDSQGVMLANGYFLQNGEVKVYDQVIDGIRFQERVSSPNGEDLLYIFHYPSGGLYLLIMYNLIGQKMSTPIYCNGFTIFDNGLLCYFKAEETATKHHVIQIWQTPFSEEITVNKEHEQSLLFKIGNKDLVRAMAEIQELMVFLGKNDQIEGVYHDVSKQAKDILDSYYWIGAEETFLLNETLEAIKLAADQAINEFEKVKKLKENTLHQTERVAKKSEVLFQKIKMMRLELVNDFVEGLSQLRMMRGETIALKELRYCDIDRIDQLEFSIKNEQERLAQSCILFLSKLEALDPYKVQLDEVSLAIEKVSKVSEGQVWLSKLQEVGSSLELLTEIVSNLKIEDTTVTTTIIERISFLFSRLNELRSRLSKRIKSLGSVEAEAQFYAQLKLIDQSVISFLDIADNVEKNTEYLNKLMVQIEELEGRFSDFDNLIEQLVQKREEVYEAFETKRNLLIETRNRRIQQLFNSGVRVLKSIATRLATFDTQEEINTYMVTDLMVEKVRATIQELLSLEDSGKSDELATALKMAREDAIRQLRDKKEIFENDQTLKLGNHRFNINKQELDLTMVYKDEQLQFHLLGTAYYEEVLDAELQNNKGFWSKELESESEHVYRAEYLAWQLYQSDNLTHDDLLKVCSQAAATRYSEGYIKGVHDHDAAKILELLIKARRDAQVLSFLPNQRFLGLAWWFSLDEENKRFWLQFLRQYALLHSVYKVEKGFEFLLDRLNSSISEFYEINDFDFQVVISEVSAYILEQFGSDLQPHLLRSTVEEYETFIQVLKEKKWWLEFENTLQLCQSLGEKFKLCSDWISVLRSHSVLNGNGELEELIFLIIYGLPQHFEIKNLLFKQRIGGFIGSHPLLIEGNYLFSYYSFIKKLSEYQQTEVVAYRKFLNKKLRLIEDEKRRMRLETFKPKVLGSFVRNKLINEVYLPLFGDNLVKQLGSSDQNKRNDRSGMLLLTSPPGYGKTTLMEYLANRLGLVFVKINGPSLGHKVSSLDPAEAGNAAAALEIEKLNFGFEMADNIMIYLDDIQHCSPEFLQKFISLADGQRKIDGVWKGHARTYDFRGKKVCVVMAGNPYTESGDKFKIPDMLANRADIYNLGDIVGNSERLFLLSMLENAMGANEVLRRVLAKNHHDAYVFIDQVEQNRNDLTLEASYSNEEADEIRSIMKHLIRVRDVVAKVNSAYIQSAAMADNYRKEPHFLLQGSYRDMSTLAAKINAVMNEEEINQLLDTHYKNESQTLTTHAEANLLKYYELCGRMTETQQVRWNEIKRLFLEQNALKQLGGDEQAAYLQQLMQMSGFLGGIEQALSKNKKPL